MKDFDHLLDPLLSASEMRKADSYTSETLGLPTRTLMETAGRAAADVLKKLADGIADRRIIVFCGPGNNGGDGLVVARVLHHRGAHVQVALVGEESQMSDNSRANLDLLRHIAEHGDRLEILRVQSPEILNPFQPDWIVDGLLGIGAKGELREPFRAMTVWMNASPAPILALDIPTGLDAGTGEASPDTIVAAATITFGAAKNGHYLGKGRTFSGDLFVADIGIPDHVLRRGRVRLSTDAAVRTMWPKRASNAHKYSAGRVLVVAGSHDFPGAAILSGNAASAAGAGAVTIATAKSARPLVQYGLVEVMSTGLPETDNGTLGIDAYDSLQSRLERADTVVLGPGIGRHPDTTKLVHRFLATLSLPAVIDADALHALAGHLDILRRYSGGRWILTPHLGELRTLLGDESIQPEDRFDLAPKVAQDLQCIVVLKGAPTILAVPDGSVYIPEPSSSALATAGTGDVLSGVIGSLLAQGVTPTAAALAALHATGRAAQYLVEHRSSSTIIASELIRAFPFSIPE